MPVSIFFLVFEYRRKGKPNGVQLTWNFTNLIFGPEEGHWVKELGQKSPGLPTRVGVRPPPGRVGLPRGQLGHLLDVRPTPKIPINIETPEKKPRSGVPPPEASVATENQSRPVPAPCQRWDPLRWPSSSSRRCPWRGGSSSSLGLRVCTSSYVFDLSLSLMFLIWHELDVSRALLL